MQQQRMQTSENIDKQMTEIRNQFVKPLVESGPPSNLESTMTQTYVLGGFGRGGDGEAEKN